MPGVYYYIVETWLICSFIPNHSTVHKSEEKLVCLWGNPLYFCMLPSIIMADMKHRFYGLTFLVWQSPPTLQMWGPRGALHPTQVHEGSLWIKKWAWPWGKWIYIARKWHLDISMTLIKGVIKLAKKPWLETRNPHDSARRGIWSTNLISLGISSSSSSLFLLLQ